LTFIIKGIKTCSVKCGFSGPDIARELWLCGSKTCSWIRNRLVVVHKPAGRWCGRERRVASW